MTLRWHLWVDWDGDGVFEADEGGPLYGATMQRGRKNVIAPSGNGFEPPQPGSGTLLLLDLDGRYDSWNEASPIYPNFTANKRFRLEVEENGTVWPVMAGNIKKIQRVEGDVPAVRLDIEGAWALLGEKVWVTMQSNLYAGDAMGLVLDAAGWPADKRDLSTGVDEKTVWWASGVSARQALHELAEAEYGTLVMRADGTVRFRSRHDFYDVVATVTGADIQRGYRIPLPWEVVRTVARVRAYLPKDTSGLLYEYQASVPVQGSETTEIFVSVQDVYIGEITSLEHTANASADGTGADMSDQVTVSATLLSPQRAKLEIANSSTGTVYLQSVKFYGSGVTMDGFVDREARNDAGAGLYGERALVVNVMWLQDALVAKDIADHLAWWYGEPAPERAAVEVRLKDRPALQFGVDVGDVVSLDLGSIQGDYRLVHVEHHWLDRTGRAVETKWLLQPVFTFTDMYWFFPTQLGVTSRFGF